MPLNAGRGREDRWFNPANATVKAAEEEKVLA